MNENENENFSPQNSKVCVFISPEKRILFKQKLKEKYKGAVNVSDFLRMVIDQFLEGTVEYNINIQTRRENE